MSDRELGTVKWFRDSKGYGFIKAVSGSTGRVRTSTELLCNMR
jgi:hypothetical protein